MTMQPAPERRPKKIDLNLLPPEYLPKKASRLTIGLIVAAIILACVPWPFLVMQMGVKNDNSVLDTQLKALKQQLAVINNEINQCNAVQADIDACEEQYGSMWDDLETVQDMVYVWSQIMADVQEVPRGAGGSLGDIRQTGDTITVKGEFAREKYVYEYSIMLSETGHFSSVTIKSMSLQEGESGNVYNFDIEAKLKEGGSQ